jgi:hypothetical protein
MLKLMLSFGFLLTSLVGFSGALLGSRRAAKASNARGAKPVRAPLAYAPFCTYEIAVLMR